jgi:hypothetical protein
MNFELVYAVKSLISYINTDTIFSGLFVASFSYLVIKSLYTFCFVVPPEFSTKFQHPTSPEFTRLWADLVENSQNILMQSKNSIPFISESNLAFFDQAIRGTMGLDFLLIQNPSLFGLAFWFLSAFCTSAEFLEISMPAQGELFIIYHENLPLLPLEFFNSYLDSLHSLECAAFDTSENMLYGFNSQRALDKSYIYLDL